MHEGNFLRHAIDSPTRGHEILDLLVTNASEPFGNTKIQDKPGVKSRHTGGVCRPEGKVKKKENHVLYESKLPLLQGASQWDPRETALRDKEAEQDWQIFKDMSTEHKS